MAADVLIGMHATVAGGLHNAFDHGQRLGADVVQVFTRNQRQWAAKPMSAEEAERFRQARDESPIDHVLSHGSYLVNLASPKPEVQEKSRQAFLEEARRCHALGIDRFVFHPGAHLGRGTDEGVQRIAQAVAWVLDETAGSGVRLLLETMAGQGTTIGHRMQDLGAIIESAGGHDRLGVCVDTCHVFAAGHDIRSRDGYEELLEEMGSAFGLGRVAAFHLNDSKQDLGSRRDRHANVGQGHIGTEGFRHLVTDPRWRRTPMALETPGGDEGYATDLRRLRALAA